MKLLFLCKQKYMRRDLIHDRYGRLYELPRNLSMNHDVRVIAMNYQLEAGFSSIKKYLHGDNRVEWMSLKINFLILPTLIYYIYILYREFRQNPPDLIIGCSDGLHVILAVLLGRISGVRTLVDLYDNFETFGLTRIPGIGMLYRQAITRADVVICVSMALEAEIRQKYRTDKPVHTIESTINKTDFYPVSRQEARLDLGLDINAIYIGTAGALYRSRGINVIYDAWQNIIQEYPDIRLLLAGEPDTDCPIPDNRNVVYLGNLPHDRMNKLYNALDVGFIYMRDDDFGRFSFPQKAFEILACKIPVLCARVGVFPDLFHQQDEFLYAPDNVQELQGKIITLLERPSVPDIKIPTWEQQANKMDKIIQQSGE